jgi:hypothetical protein
MVFHFSPWNRFDSVFLTHSLPFAQIEKIQIGASVVIRWATIFRMYQ